jgi:hypothetical protein
MEEQSPIMPQPGQKQVDEMRLQMLLNQIRDNQNLAMAAIGGLVAALVGSVVWAAITYITNYQIGILAIGIGFLVGITVRHVGKGIDQVFGVVGGVLSLLGCAVGNLLTVCVIIAEQNSMSIAGVLGHLTPEAAWELMVETFNVLDVIFYALAAYYGYRTSIRSLTEEEIQSVMR